LDFLKLLKIYIDYPLQIKNVAWQTTRYWLWGWTHELTIKKWNPFRLLILASIFIILPVSCGTSTTTKIRDAKPTNHQVSAFDSATRIRLIVTQSYYDDWSVDSIEALSLPFETVACRLLQNAGYSLVSSDSNRYDLVVKIEVIGRAMSDMYGRNLRGSLSAPPPYEKLYTGALLEGVILLEMSEVPTYNKKFMVFLSPPDRIDPIEDKNLVRFKREWGRHPYDAPFWTAFNDSRGFITAILETLYYVRGIGPLITTLEDEDPYVRTASLMILRQVTHKYFGYEPEEWRQWWGQNKTTYR